MRAVASPTFSNLLKHWRAKRRLSQLELALDSGVSQRHVSFLESGRARPSRAMVLQLSEALQVPLRERNQWLLSAGFAPLYQARSLESPPMAQVMAAVQMMLANHAPFPAAAIDPAWNLRLANPPFYALSSFLGDTIWQAVGGPQPNLFRLFFHPHGLRPFVRNWATAAPLLWNRARREAEAHGGEELRQLVAELAPLQDANTLYQQLDAPLLPVLPLEIEKDGLRISLFTVISTFGTAQDITAEELRLESFFPADAATEAFFRASAHNTAGTHTLPQP